MNSELLIILNLCLTFVVLGVSGSCDLGTYGRNCEKNCSQYCASDIDEYVHCDQRTGHCSEGCVPGWYGGTCMLPCSSHCNNRTCNQQTGRCTLGCVEDHTGDDCEKETVTRGLAKRTPRQTSSTAIIIVAAFISVIVFIIIIIGALIAWFKCRRPNEIRQEQIPLKNREQGADDSTVLDAPVQHYEAAPSPERGELHVDTDLHDACNRGNLPRVTSILSQGKVHIESIGMHGRTAIMLAAYWGHGDMFNVIMREQPDVSKLDTNGNNILHLACYGGDMKVVIYILSQNMADINSRNQQGKTPLMWAASCGHKKLFIYLLVIGHADMSQVDNDGNTVLHWACCGGNIEVVDYVLLQPNVCIDSRGHEGKTPAMMAAEKGHKSLDLLKRKGADLSLKDTFSNNAYQLARLNGHEEITEDLAASCLVM